MSNQDQLNELRQIRSLMERSSRFISLSGLSGVGAGVCALIGAAVAHWYLGIGIAGDREAYNIVAMKAEGYQRFFLLDATFTLLAALAIGFYFTNKKARKSGQKFWDKSAQLMVMHLAIPLVTGGLFCLWLLYEGLFGMIAPCTLLFYGLALVNGSKYTLHDVLYLGLAQIVLGLLGLLFIGYGMLFWEIGFGVLHIIYGIMMYKKYN
jgi:hypothetical protein